MSMTTTETAVLSGCEAVHAPQPAAHQRLALGVVFEETQVFDQLRAVADRQLRQGERGDPLLRGGLLDRRAGCGRQHAALEAGEVLTRGRVRVDRPRRVRLVDRGAVRPSTTHLVATAAGDLEGPDPFALVDRCAVSHTCNGQPQRRGKPANPPPGGRIGGFAAPAQIRTWSHSHRRPR
jgi:hypothetical protein